MSEENHHQELVTVAELLRIAGQLMTLLLRELDLSSVESEKPSVDERQQIGIWLTELGNALQEKASQRRSS